MGTTDKYIILLSLSPLKGSIRHLLATKSVVTVLKSRICSSTLLFPHIIEAYASTVEFFLEQPATFRDPNSVISTTSF